MHSLSVWLNIVDALRDNTLHCIILTPVAEAFFFLSLECSLAGQRGQPSWTRRATPCSSGSSRLWRRSAFFYRWDAPLQASLGNQAGHEERRHAFEGPCACGGGLPSFIAGVFPCRPAWATKLDTKGESMY